MILDALCPPGQQEILQQRQSRVETGGERKGRMMRLYMRQSLRSAHGRNNRYGNR
jgi:hypothetical protein